MPRRKVTISVIIPCRNAVEYIGETLLSLRKQHYPDLEIVIVDGQSTDGTDFRIAEFRDLNIKFSSEPDQGQLDALQKGLKRATGEIVGWLNADDVLMPGVLSYVAHEFLGSPHIDLIYSDNFAFDGQKRALYVGSTIQGLTFLDHCLFYRQMYSECVYWRRNKTKFLSDEYFSLRVYTDYAFFLNLRRGLREKWVRKRLGAFRISPLQISRTQQDRKQSEYAWIRRQLYAKLSWSPLRVFAHKVLLAPLFFLRMRLTPDLKAAMRRMARYITADRRRSVMTEAFFSGWLDPTSTDETFIRDLLER